jgi:GT2 family glycosyltransferase
VTIDDATYHDWIDRFDTVRGAELAAARAFGERLVAAGAPRIDVAMPVYDPPEAFLRAAIASVKSQIYENWTLSIVDDGSTAPHVKPILDEAARSDSRIRVDYSGDNGGIARATNAAVALGTSDVVVLVDHDDVVPPHALLLVAHRFLEHPATNLLYGDFDFIGQNGARTTPFFKPDFDPELLLGLNFVASLTAYRRSLFEEIGGMRGGYTGSDDYDLVLRAVERIPANTILHVPHVLYHWRIVVTSSSRARGQTAIDSARRAVREHCERRGLRASLSGTPRSFIWNRVRFLSPAPPSVAVVIEGGSAEERARLRSVLESRTDYPRVEYLPTSGQGDGLARFRNSAVAGADAELVLFLDARLVPRAADWLSEMASHFEDRSCAAVGGRVLFEDGRVERCGTLLGVRDPVWGGPVARAFHGALPSAPSYFGRDEIAMRASAVSGGALLVRRAVLDAVSGFDERLAHPTALDVDFCLRARGNGAFVVHCPHAAFVASRGEPDDGREDSTRILVAKWGAALEADPFYSPNLTAEDPDFGLAFPPRVRFPWTETG